MDGRRNWEQFPAEATECGNYISVEFLVRSKCVTGGGLLIISCFSQDWLKQALIAKEPWNSGVLSVSKTLMTRHS